MQGFEVIQQHTVLDNAIYHLFTGACNNDATYLQNVQTMHTSRQAYESPFAEEKEDAGNTLQR